MRMICSHDFEDFSLWIYLAVDFTSILVHIARKRKRRKKVKK